MINPLSAPQVADALGVELATVYAYASRGILTRRTVPGDRRSWYDRDQVEALARRSRPRSSRRRTAAVDVVIGTTISEIGDGWIRYRGHDLLDLAAERSFEDVCTLLWTGNLPDPGNRPGTDRAATRDVRRASRRASEALPDASGITARLAVGLMAGAGVTPNPEGATVLDALVAALPVRGDEPPEGASIARSLWPCLSTLPATQPRVAALELALVLLAEHELATSTLAVRVASSTGASAPACVLAGLGAVSGPLHGQAAARIHHALVAGDTTTEGYGHPVHLHGDPRYAPLQAAVLGIAGAKRRRVIEAGASGDGGAELPPPTVDVALAGLGCAIDAEPGATEAVFAIARTAGWLAHAYEEADEPPLRFRGRTLYRGGSNS